MPCSANALPQGWCFAFSTSRQQGQSFTLSTNGHWGNAMPSQHLATGAMVCSLNDRPQKVTLHSQLPDTGNNSLSPQHVTNQCPALSTLCHKGNATLTHCPDTGAILHSLSTPRYRGDTSLSLNTQTQGRYFTLSTPRMSDNAFLSHRCSASLSLNVLLLVPALFPLNALP